MAFSHVYWQALTGFAVLFFGLGTAAAAAAAHADKGSISLPIFLFTNAGLLCAAAVFVQKRRNPLEIPDVGVGEALIVAGGASLYIQIAVRLCAASASFGGTIGRFDFGLKCGYRNATAGVESCSESNEAFEPEFNSFGHTMQGFLSFLLFPVLANALCNRIPQRNATWRPTLRHALSTASCWVVFYPVYNIIKRTVKDDKYNEGVKAWKAFAASSFCNNGAEWACGFALGISAGLLAMAALGGDTAALPLLGDEYADECVARAHRAVQALKVGCGGLLLGTSLLSAVLFGTTWHNSAAKGFAEDAADAAVTVFFVFVPTTLIVALTAYHYSTAKLSGRDTHGGMVVRMEEPKVSVVDSDSSRHLAHSIMTRDDRTISGPPSSLELTTSPSQSKLGAC